MNEQNTLCTSCGWVGDADDIESQVDTYDYHNKRYIVEDVCPCCAEAGDVIHLHEEL